jgi:hypothetical protein
LRKPSSQATKVLPYLFERIDAQQPVTVFHVGPALPETVNFFSTYRCKLHFIDVFAALPLTSADEEAPTVVQQIRELLRFPANTVFDICLFWDLFNFLDDKAIKAFLTVLRPHLKNGGLAHAFSVHNLRTRQDSHLYGINQQDTLSYRNRRTEVPGYAPHSQRELKDLLACFNVERSVLLPDSRLELLLQARL